jgi:hypothetical protein
MSMIEALPSFKTQAILDVFNHLAVAKGDKPLAGWEKSKSSLVARIMAGNDAASIEAAIKATEDGVKPGTKAEAKPAKKVAKTNGKAKPAKAEKKAKADGEAKPRVQGVGAFIREVLTETPEATANDVLAMVQKKWPEAKTSAACVGWYRSQMYKNGDLKKAAVQKARAAEGAK